MLNFCIFNIFKSHITFNGSSIKATPIIWIVFVSIVIQRASASRSRFHNYDDYIDDLEPEAKDAVSLNALQRPNKLFFNGLTRSDIMKLAATDSPSIETTECITEPSAAPPPPAPPPPPPPPPPPAPPQDPEARNGVDQSTPAATKPEPPAISKDDNDNKDRLIKNLVQLLYVAQARVQLEAAEIKKAQAVANSAQQALEEAANHVRTITANLQTSQHEVANAAIRAQTAQLQLAAHDQLLFAARQDVDALSTQLVGLQAAEGITQPKTTVDVADLLERLKQPLQEAEKPTRVPSVIKSSTQATNLLPRHKLQHYNAADYQRFYYQ